MRGTADSLREALSVCFTLLNERHNKDLSRCARVQLPKQPTLLCVHEENIAADPAQDAYSLLIAINIFLACAVSVATVETWILVLLLFLQIKLYLCLDNQLKVTFISIQQANI